MFDKKASNETSLVFPFPQTNWASVVAFEVMARSADGRDSIKDRPFALVVPSFADAALLLVAMPFVPGSFLATSSDAPCY